MKKNVLGKCYQISENTVTPLLWSNFLLQKRWQTELDKLFFSNNSLAQTISYSEHMPNEVCVEISQTKHVSNGK